MAISTHSFRYVSRLAREQASIVLSTGKEYLVESRLSPLARDEGFENLDGFLAHLGEQGTDAPLVERVVDALTTNETFFFRDFHVFEALRTQIIPRLIQSRASTKRLNIWSAAASTGQEAYSLAIVLRESFPELADWRIRILGTDISPSVLDRARKGEYTQLEVNRGLPASYLIKYFDNVNERWRVNADLRSMVEFQRKNICHDWGFCSRFDIVLMRNILIYFDIETKKEIISKLRASVQPDSFLLLGTAESLQNISTDWESVYHGKATYYQLRD